MPSLCIWSCLLISLLLHPQDPKEPSEEKPAPVQSPGGQTESDRGSPTLAVLVFAATPPAGADRDRIAQGLGLVVKDGIPGTEEGHALSELHYWISWEDFDLAEAAFRFGCGGIRSTPVRFVRSWALLRWAIQKGRDFDRVAASLEEIRTSDKTFREHVDALARSVRAVIPCRTCQGKGRIRCVQCYGTGTVRGGSDAAEIVSCTACEKGDLKCLKCEGPRRAPALGDICEASPCDLCDGRGLLFKTVRWPCAECWGLGQKLAPKVNPGKKLP